MGDLGQHLANASREKRIYALQFLPRHLADVLDIDRLYYLLTNIFFLEGKATAVSIFDLAADFTRAIEIMSDNHPSCRILKLLEEAIRRDIHFIARHARDYPQALFQCLLNSCWWYDCPEAAKHLGDLGDRDFSKEPVKSRPRLMLSTLMEEWRMEKEGVTPGFCWVRSMRPPGMPLTLGPNATLRGHSGGVDRIAWSRDGSLIVSTSHDLTMRVWDIRSGMERRCFQASNDMPLRSLELSTDMRVVAGGGGDGAIVLWDLERGEERYRFFGHRGSVESLAISPDGSRLATCSFDGMVRMWDISEAWKASLVAEKSRQGCVMRVKFSHDGRLLRAYSRSREGRTLKIKSWSIRTWRSKGTKVLQGTSWGCPWVISNDPRTIVTAHGASNISSISVDVWDAEDGYQYCLRGPKRFVYAVACSMDGQLVAGGYTDGLAQVWDAKTKECLASLHATGGDVQSLSFSPVGNFLACGVKDGTIHLWDVECLPGEGETQPRAKERINCMAFSPDGEELVIGSRDSVIRTYGVSDGLERERLSSHKLGVVDLAYSPDGQQLASGSADSTVSLWDVKRRVEASCLYGESTGEHCHLAYSPDGQYLASVSYQANRIHLWHTGTGEAIAVDWKHDYRIRGLAFSRRGSFLASASLDKTVRVWDITKRMLHVCFHHPADVECVAFSPINSHLVSGSDDGDLRVWDISRNCQVFCIRAQDDEVHRVAYSADGRSILSFSDFDKVTNIWDAQTGKLIHTIEGSGDLAAIAAGPTNFPLRAVTRSLETTIESQDRNEAVAWFPPVCERIWTHPSGRVWAGTRAGDWYLFEVIGKVGSRRDVQQMLTALRDESKGR